MKSAAYFRVYCRSLLFTFPQKINFYRRLSFFSIYVIMLFRKEEEYEKIWRACSKKNSQLSSSSFLASGSINNPRSSWSFLSFYRVGSRFMTANSFMINNFWKFLKAIIESHFYCNYSKLFSVMAFVTDHHNNVWHLIKKNGAVIGHHIFWAGY